MLQEKFRTRKQTIVLYASNGTDYSIRVPALGGKGYYIQEAKYPKVQDIQKTCEPGWIPIGNRCVMQYEAKAKVKNGQT